MKNNLYVLIQDGPYYCIYENKTAQCIFRSSTKKQAVQLLNLLKDGSGFAGETPAFMTPVEVRTCLGANRSL